MQKYRDRNGKCIAILFKSIGVRGRFGSSEGVGARKSLPYQRFKPFFSPPMNRRTQFWGLFLPFFLGAVGRQPPPANPFSKPLTLASCLRLVPGNREPEFKIKNFGPLIKQTIMNFVAMVLGGSVCQCWSICLLAQHLSKAALAMVLLCYATKHPRSHYLYSWLSIPDWYVFWLQTPWQPTTCAMALPSTIERSGNFSTRALRITMGALLWSFRLLHHCFKRRALCCSSLL